jgi:hypothetical protein
MMALLSSEWVDISRKSRSQPQVFYSVLGTAKQVSPPTDAFSNCLGPCRAHDRQRHLAARRKRGSVPREVYLAEVLRRRE